MVDINRYATIEPYIDAQNLPHWVEGDDRIRIAAYDMYEAIFWTVKESFEIQMHAQEGEPILIPSGRKIVNTSHRYLAPQFAIVVDPDFGTDDEQTNAKQIITDFVRRERFYSKFSANKRLGLMRGDWLWHIMADPQREEGSRISIQPLDPSLYFPEYKDGNVDEIVAVHIAEPTLTTLGTPAIRKLTYRKVNNSGGPSPIHMTDALFLVNEWGQPQTEMRKGPPLTTYADEDLSPEIDQIPIYHISNEFEPGEEWGSSEMRGIERLMVAINQGITDEEVTLVMEGLGVYATDSGPPVDDEGQEVAWNIGPGRVVEKPPGSDFERVSAEQNVQPYQDHLAYLHGQLDESVGINDVTAGRVDVITAQSGVALMLRMAPLFARLDEKELHITDVHNNLLYDLRKWFKAYESINLDSIRWMPSYGDRLPINKSELLQQIVQMVQTTPPMISTSEARRMLTRAGFKFTDDTELFAEILQERSDFIKVVSDAEATALRAAAAEGAVPEEAEVPEGMSLPEFSDRVDTAVKLIQFGFDPEAALEAVGLDPIKHLNLIPARLARLPYLAQVPEAERRPISGPTQQ